MRALLPMLLRIRSLCIKELLVILKDPANRFVLVVPIIVQSLIFGYAATYDLEYIPYAVCDRSRSSYSRDLLARLDGTGKFVRVATLENSDGIRDMIWNGDALLALDIGPDFAGRLTSGRDAEVLSVLDGRNSTTASAAQGYLASIVAGWNEAHGNRAPVKTAVRAWFNPQLETRWNIMIGLVATLSLLQIMLLSALSVAREREQGTFDQMLVTPLLPWEILVGKAIPPVLVGIAQSTLIFLVAVFWFEIPFQGHAADLYLSLLAFTLSCSGLGLCISAIALTMQQAMVCCFVVIMPMILLSGFTTPVHAMPELLQQITYANPLRFALDCIRRIYLEGATAADVAANFIPMLSVAAATLPCAGWLFKNRLR